MTSCNLYYYKFFLNKIGLGDDIFLRENKLLQSDLVLKNEKYNQNDEIKLNSFSLVLEKVKSFPEKAVSVIMDTNENKEVEYNIFTQDGFIIQKDEKTQNVTEELVLYLFLGVFTIFVVDSFARAGKYTR